jgi:dihydroorotase
VKEINGEGKYLLPGAIDDQVHFREPGLTHKATIYTEAKAAVAGGCYQFYGNAKYNSKCTYTGIIRRQIFDRFKNFFSQLFFFYGHQQ